MEQEGALRIRIRLYCGDEIAMGPGKADLLREIHQHGSISAAARALGMSYRRAWLLVDTMNRCWAGPLVATTPGSAHDGARVTPRGDTVLARYRALQEAVDDAARGAAFLALEGEVRPAPAPGPEERRAARRRARPKPATMD